MGPGSLQDVADTMRGLASDVTACSQAHALADGKAAPANGLVGPVDVRAFDSGLLKMALGSVAVASQFPTIATLLASSPATSWLLYELVKDNEDGQAAVETLQLLLNDPTTEQWVKEDLVRIVLLTRWLNNAKTGREPPRSRPTSSRSPSASTPGRRTACLGRSPSGRRPSTPRA